jgi:alpha-glucosidase
VTSLAESPDPRADGELAGPPPFEGVVYQIYPRSFLDTDGDGVGDLAGIQRHLDHLVWLGVDAVWLSPIYRSPMADFGYDVADHTDVDPLFGTLDDADRLVEAAHARGLEIWLDFVPNHTSDQHPWFQASRSSRDDPKRTWYVWRDPAPDGAPPNNWRAHFPPGEPAWTFDDTTGQYYLHQFLPEQPDVNWEDPGLTAAMHDVLRFWLERGVDGFRADVVHLIGNDPDYPDDPEHLLEVGRAGYHEHPRTLEHLRGIRAVLEEYDALIVGEVNLPDAARVAAHVGPDTLHLGFYFGLVYAPWEARSWRDIIRYADGVFTERGAWPTWVLGNHDSPRPRTRFGSDARARAATTLLLTLRGVPFLYAGDELGLEDAEVPADQALDPGGRDGCRAPLPWDEDELHGWAGDPWLPFPPDASERSVAAQRRDPDASVHHVRRLLAHRRASPALVRGHLELLDLHAEVVAYRRAADDDERLVVCNFSDVDVEVAVPAPGAAPAGAAPPGGHEAATAWRVAVAPAVADEGVAFTGGIPAATAFVLAPADGTSRPPATDDA